VYYTNLDATITVIFRKILLYPKLVTHKSLRSWSWIVSPHADQCHICIFSQMVKNQSLPKLFHVIWSKPHKT